MITKHHLLDLCDRYRAAAGIEQEKTLSHRIFRDSGRLGRLRGEADITLGSYNAAMRYLALHWPDDAQRPEALLPYCEPADDGEEAA